AGAPLVPRPVWARGPRAGRPGVPPPPAVTTHPPPPRRKPADSPVWLSTAHPCAAQVPTVPSSLRRRSSGGAPCPRPPRLARTKTSTPTPAARTPISTQTHVGVLLEELEVEPARAPRSATRG